MHKGERDKGGWVLERNRFSSWITEREDLFGNESALRYLSLL